MYKCPKVVTELKQYLEMGMVIRRTHSPNAIIPAPEESLQVVCDCGSRTT